MATVLVNEWQKVAATGTAIALATANDVDWLVMKAPRTNETIIYVGASTVTRGTTKGGASTDGLPLAPGDDVTFGGCDLADVFINGTAGDGVYYVASSGYVLPAS